MLPPPCVARTSAEVHVASFSTPLIHSLSFVDAPSSLVRGPSRRRAADAPKIFATSGKRPCILRNGPCEYSLGRNRGISDGSTSNERRQGNEEGLRSQMKRHKCNGCNRRRWSNLLVGFEDVLDDGFPQGQKSRTSRLELGSVQLVVRPWCNDDLGLLLQRKVLPGERWIDVFLV